MLAPSSRNRRIVVLLLLVTLIMGTFAALSSRDALAGRVFVTANGISLQAGQPLPVYKFVTPQITPQNNTLPLSQRFDSIYARQSVAETSYRNKPRYTVPNTQTVSLLEQYGATGGFYAFRTSDLIADMPQGSVDTNQAQLLTCTFLTQNGFINGNGALLINGRLQGDVSTPNIQLCDFDPQPDPPYQATPIIAATEGVQASTQVITYTVGVVVRVPISLNTGRYSQIPSVPLGGPGGHISLLFRTTDGQDQGFSLDSSVPGLMAVAMPFYERSFQHVRNVPAVDPALVKQQIDQQVRAAYPNATNVSVPDPALLYMVSDAAQEQSAFEPMLNFSGISLTVDGQTVILKDINVPAVEAGSGANGFGPTVDITSPTNDSTFAPNAAVTITGAIGGGTAPYSYQWFREDGTALSDEATLAAPGNVQVQTTLLPVLSRDGFPLPTTVTLRVQDSDGAERTATISLRPTVAPAMYLPLVLRSGGAGMAMAQRPAQTRGDATLAASNYSFGIEAGSDYPPYGSGGADLPGVVPDANGFRSGMLNYGWSQRFSWWNSSAWERDWRDCSLGGIDCSSGVDRADFVYYAGHGGPGGLSMPSNKDSTWADAANARFQLARWVGFASCQTLRAQPNDNSAAIRRWFNSFQGAHMLLGFNSNMADIAFGPRLVENMRMPSFFGIEFPWAQLTIREAWVMTAFNMNAGKPAYIYAVGTNGVNPVNNKLPRPGDAPLSRPFPVASYHWVWWNE